MDTYKEKIISVVQKSHLLTIEEISQSIPDADFSTIYRNVEKLSRSGVLRKVFLDKHRTMYEISEKKSSHDHFFCLKCSCVEEILPPTHVLEAQGYEIVDVVVRGVCKHCNQVNI